MKDVVEGLRRSASGVLTVGFLLMAMAPCSAGPMTMAEMACCTDRHADCRMASDEGCCDTDLASDEGLRLTERWDGPEIGASSGRTIVAHPVAWCALIARHPLLEHAYDPARNPRWQSPATGVVLRI